MMCYRDRTYCDARCGSQYHCTKSLRSAMIEKAQSKDAFVRDTLPIASRDFSTTCNEYKFNGSGEYKYDNDEVSE